MGEGSLMPTYKLLPPHATLKCSVFYSKAKILISELTCSLEIKACELFSQSQKSDFWLEVHLECLLPNETTYILCPVKSKSNTASSTQL